MAKTDYSSPLPEEKLIERLSEPFKYISKGFSATIISVPHLGHTSHLRFLSSNKGVLVKLGLENSNFVFVDKDKITKKYESFASELLLNLSNKDISQIVNSQNAYLLNREIISQTAKITQSKKLVLAVVIEGTLINYISEIENLFLLIQKSARQFPVSILWITDTKIVRNYRRVHPSSTFLTNICYQKNFDKYETDYCLQRISDLKGKNISKNILDNSLQLTGGFACAFHQFINSGDLLSSEYVKTSLTEIKNEVKINQKEQDKLITKEGMKFLDSLDLSGSVFESIELSKNPTAQEINLLRFLQKNIDKPISRDEMAQIIWGKTWNSKYSDWAIDKAISRLRKNIVSSNYKIITVKNLGYELIKL